MSISTSGSNASRDAYTLLEETAEASNSDVVSLPDTYSFIYNPSFVSSETSSISSYKTERTINSRKSRYNILPRRKYADIGHLRHPQGLVSSDVDGAQDGASTSKVCGFGCWNNHDYTLFRPS